MLTQAFCGTVSTVLVQIQKPLVLFAQRYWRVPGPPDAQKLVEGHVPARHVTTPASFSHVCEALSQHKLPHVISLAEHEQKPFVQTWPDAQSPETQQSSTSMQRPLHSFCPFGHLSGGFVVGGGVVFPPFFFFFFFFLASAWPDQARPVPIAARAVRPAPSSGRRGLLSLRRRARASKRESSIWVLLSQQTSRFDRDAKEVPAHSWKYVVLGSILANRGHTVRGNWLAGGSRPSAACQRARHASRYAKRHPGVTLGENVSGLVFLQGAEMQPSRIRAAWPEAQFVARARLTPRPHGAVFPAVSPAYAAWGIVVAVPAEVAGESRHVTTDEGQDLRVVVPAPDDADPKAVLAAAKYWELPPPYVRSLAHVAAVPVEEYFY